MVDDDADDCRLTREVLEECHFANELRVVKDGVELLEYLRHKGRFQNPARAPRPGLIFLDLNMPRMDGRAVLKEIKSDPFLNRIPLVILSSSNSEEDIFKCYDLGAKSYVQKPVTSEALCEVLQALDGCWFRIVEAA